MPETETSTSPTTTPTEIAESLLNTAEFSAQTFTFKHKKYTIRKPISFGQYLRMQKMKAEGAEIEEQLRDDSLEKQARDDLEARSEIVKNALMQLVADVLERSVVLKQKDLDDLDFPDAMSLFVQVVSRSTTIPKK